MQVKTSSTYSTQSKSESKLGQAHKHPTMQLPKLGENLSAEHIKLAEAVAKSCRRSIIEMVTNAQSGHPGGSLSTIDYLAILYTFIINQSNEPVIVSNGHISPAVYSILAELKVIPKNKVVELFRKPSDIYEGHINREVQGVHYGTGPLGVGGSVASAFALADKLSGREETTYLIMGDGEQQEGQVFEMINFANKYKLDNLVMFIDYNKVQLTASLEEIMPLDLHKIYEAAGWNVIDANAHDFEEIWKALSLANANQGSPTVILGHSIMGQGVGFMQETGENNEATWHGKAPKPEMIEEVLSHELALNEEETAIINEFLSAYPSQIKTQHKVEEGSDSGINTGEPKLYASDELTDCRSAYGNALGDLAALNNNVVALTADLEGSVKTGSVKKTDPLRHIECGIAEQHMVSTAGGMSLRGFVPFCSTFGAFMSSRAKDQARVNDINECNVKMVATHCGISVGEDGPTHQAIDDISSFKGFFHTNILEPADPNQCDRIIRFVANHQGNFYVRMGRSKVPVITKEDGGPFFDKNYKFELGKADIIREGSDVTVVASGPMVIRALEAHKQLKGDKSVEVICVSSHSPFDAETIVNSAKKTGKVITVEDHHIESGLGASVLKAIAKAGLGIEVETMGVTAYQLSGTSDQLYEKLGLTTEEICKKIKN